MANKGSLKTHLFGKKSFGATPNGFRFQAASTRRVGNSLPTMMTNILVSNRPYADYPNHPQKVSLKTSEASSSKAKTTFQIRFQAA